MSDSALRINVQVKPRASKDAIEGWKEGVLIVRLSAPPVEGAANKALVRLLSSTLKIAKGRIRIVSGEKGRRKVIEFEGVTIEDLKVRLR